MGPNAEDNTLFIHEPNETERGQHKEYAATGVIRDSSTRAFETIHGICPVGNQVKYDNALAANQLNAEVGL